MRNSFVQRFVCVWKKKKKKKKHARLLKSKKEREISFLIRNANSHARRGYGLNLTPFDAGGRKSTRKCTISPKNGTPVIIRQNYQEPGEKGRLARWPGELSCSKTRERRLFYTWQKSFVQKWTNKNGKCSRGSVERRGEARPRRALLPCFNARHTGVINTFTTNDVVALRLSSK